MVHVCCKQFAQICTNPAGVWCDGHTTRVKINLNKGQEPGFKTDLVVATNDKESLLGCPRKK